MHMVFQSEYVAEYDRRLEFISGFSGSNGQAIVTLYKAALWTDGRYHLQADDQLNCDWLLMRQGHKNVPSPAEWLKMQLPPGSRIGADPRLIANGTWYHLESELEDSGLKLIELRINPIDKIWTEDRPPQRNKDVFIWNMKYAGMLNVKVPKNTIIRFNLKGAILLIMLVDKKGRYFQTFVQLFFH